MALIHFIERELVLEEEMFNRGKDRFFANIARLKEQRNEGGTTYGKMLLKRGIAPLAAAITAFMEKANSGTAGRRHMAVALLKDIAPDVAAFITLRTAIAPLTSEPMLQNVAVRVGREIEAELRRNAETTATAFENQLDALYSAEAMDISTDIEVLDSILKSQNLAK